MRIQKGTLQRISGTGVLVGLLLASGGCLQRLTPPSDPAVLALLASGRIAPAAMLGRLPLKTYQTTCWDDAGANIPCAGTGQDGEIQSGRAADFAGPTLVGAADHITVDASTGLVWATCNRGQTFDGSTCSGPAAFGDFAAAGSACAALNGAGYGGRTDWRSPSVDDLESLTNYNANSPAAFATYFPGSLLGANWTSSIDQGDVTYSWLVYGGTGQTTIALTSSTANIRCVSGSSPSPSSFADNGDGTVLDQGTGLVWQRCTRGDTACTGASTSATWSVALSYCNGLTLAGRTWRLPNVNELKSLLRRNTYNPALPSVFPWDGVATSYTWSSSSYAPLSGNAGNTAQAWQARAYDGLVSSFSKGSSYAVRCVSGP